MLCHLSVSALENKERLATSFICFSKEKNGEEKKKEKKKKKEKRKKKKRKEKKRKKGAQSRSWCTNIKGQTSSK